MLSFIIPAHDEAALIGSAIRAIHSAANHTGAAYEIIVVDDASSDGTGAVAEAAAAHVIRIEAQHIAAARNAGAAVARGETLVFVDADTLVTEAVVRGVIEAMRAGAIGGGADVAIDAPAPYYARALMPLIVLFNRCFRLASGCFLFCARRAFESVGGFDERMFAAEEVAMSRALKRHGRFVVLRHAVITSARKLRTHSGWEIFATFVGLALGGSRALRDRRRLALWYGPRRRDRL